MIVALTDFLGNEYEIANAELVVSAIAGPCIRGSYKPAGELVTYDQGDFRLETCKSWEVLTALPVGRNGDDSSAWDQGQVAVPSGGGGA